MIINNLKSAILDTSIGQMIAIADEQKLYLLEFTDRPALPTEIKNLEKKTKSEIIEGKTKAIDSIKNELKLYFDGNLRDFKTPIHFFGSSFQISVWEELLRIKYGQTRSYLDQAKAVGRESAVRAVANANGKNQLAIIVPCHRIIRNNMALGGYGGGLARKKWLIEHESNWSIAKT